MDKDLEKMLDEGKITFPQAKREQEFRDSGLEREEYEAKKKERRGDY